MAFEIRKSYDFVTHAPNILKGVYKNWLVVGILDANQASTYDDVFVIHQQVLDQLPAGTPADISQLTFYLFKGPEGETNVLAEEWIDSSTIQQVSVGTLKVTVPNASSSDLTDIKSLLQNLGYNNFDIRLET